MDMLTSAWNAKSIGWLLITVVAGGLSGYLAARIKYYFKRKEIIDTVLAEVQKQQEIKILEAKRDHSERIRKEILRWTNPILAAVKDLQYRLKNILEDDGYRALSPDYDVSTAPNWAVSYDYFFKSTLFVFGQYFAWVQMLREELSFELFQSHKEEEEFFNAINEVQEALAGFPLNHECSGKDTQVFRLQQRAIAELFILRDKGSRRCISYPEFLESADKSQFDHHLKPLQLLLQGITNGEDCRWKRLAATLSALGELRANCEKVLSIERT